MQQGNRVALVSEVLILLEMVSDLGGIHLPQITGKAVMLDEIINYVQSLQQQVEVRQLFSYSGIRIVLNEFNTMHLLIKIH